MKHFLNDTRHSEGTLTKCSCSITQVTNSTYTNCRLASSDTVEVSQQLLNFDVIQIYDKQYYQLGFTKTKATPSSVMKHEFTLWKPKEPKKQEGTIKKSR